MSDDSTRIARLEEQVISHGNELHRLTEQHNRNETKIDDVLRFARETHEMVIALKTQQAVIPAPGNSPACQAHIAYIQRVERDIQEIRLRMAQDMRDTSERLEAEMTRLEEGVVDKVRGVVDTVEKNKTEADQRIDEVHRRVDRIAWAGWGLFGSLLIVAAKVALDLFIALPRPQSHQHNGTAQPPGISFTLPAQP